MARAEVIAREQRRGAQAQNSKLITRGDDCYPPTLLDLDLPPPVLYSRGTIPTRPSISIVGSRKASSTNLEIARMFGRELAAAGLTVVSGLARGIDQAAHRGALAAPAGTTVAILGCGIDVDYPASTRQLVEEIERSGAVVSEFPLGARPYKANFPIRNRLIAALSVGTLVVQATVRSGSLITARLAVDLSRDVYGVPGSILDGASAGPNSLIRDGALLVQSTRDILESLPLAVRDRIPVERHGRDGDLRVTDPSPNALLSALSQGRSATVEELAARTSLPHPRILQELLELEIQGLIRRRPGPVYIRTL
jgi:DNA processing protein